MTTDTISADGAPSEGAATPAEEVAPAAAGAPAAAAAEPAVDSEAPATPGVTPAPPPEGDATPPEPRRPKRDRIQELTAERNFWRDKAMGEQPAKPAAEPAAATPPEAPPTLEQFEYDTDKWSQAYAKWSDERVKKLVGQSLAERQAQEQASTIEEQFHARETAFAQSTPDYHEAVSDPELQRYVTPTISEAIVTSEHGPQLSFYLATHRDELAAIARLRPAAQGVALGKLEAKLASAPPPTPKPPAPALKQPTRAPAPPSPVGGNNAPSKRLEDMPLDEYMQARQRWSPVSRP